MTEKPKACPFCGGKARLYRYQHVTYTGSNLEQKYGVECTQCCAELPVRLCSEQEACTITNWNMRVADA